jgi:putative ABC transport system permease protein
VWKERITHRPFQYSFMDEDYNEMYAAELKAAKVFELFSGLAILLACMGLFAMAAYATVKRQKEIGIRKVLGASLSDITLLVSGDFLKLVLIGFLIATPLAWLAAHRWLGDFAYRIGIEWWVFAVAGVLSVCIAAFTVGYHAIRVGSANPIDSLRSE